MLTISEQVLSLGAVLWEYHDIPNAPRHCDMILALGSKDLRVGQEAGRLTAANIAPRVVLSGGTGKVTSMDGGETEARRFARVLLEMGVEANRIILEESASNTGDNFVKTREVLSSLGLLPSVAVFVTKPYMKRRALATGLKQWPEVEWIPHAPSISFRDYPDEAISAEQMIQLMVGDLQRIAVYPALGFQVEQTIPGEVKAAYRALVSLGFNKYVIKDAPPFC